MGCDLEYKTRCAVWCRMFTTDRCWWQMPASLAILPHNIRQTLQFSKVATPQLQAPVWTHSDGKWSIGNIYRLPSTHTHACMHAQKHTHVHTHTHAHAQMHRLTDSCSHPTHQHTHTNQLTTETHRLRLTKYRLALIYSHIGNYSESCWMSGHAWLCFPWRWCL